MSIGAAHFSEKSNEYAIFPSNKRAKRSLFEKKGYDYKHLERKKLEKDPFSDSGKLIGETHTLYCTPEYIQITVDKNFPFYLQEPKEKNLKSRLVVDESKLKLPKSNEKMEMIIPTTVNNIVTLATSFFDNFKGFGSFPLSNFDQNIGDKGTETHWTLQRNEPVTMDQLKALPKSRYKITSLEDRLLHLFNLYFATGTPLSTYPEITSTETWDHNQKRYPVTVAFTKRANSPSETCTLHITSFRDNDIPNYDDGKSLVAVEIV